MQLIYRSSDAAYTRPGNKQSNKQQNTHSQLQVMLTLSSVSWAQKWHILWFILISLTNHVKSEQRGALFLCETQTFFHRPNFGATIISVWILKVPGRTVNELLQATRMSSSVPWTFDILLHGSWGQRLFNSIDNSTFRAFQPQWTTGIHFFPMLIRVAQRLV